MPALTPISSLPKSVSLEEHKILVSSTPASFSDIPPILRHKQEHVALALHPPLDAFPPSECTDGTLYVIESVLVFMSPSGRGLQIEYPSITLHAISRSDTAPSIYCQLDDAVPSSHPAPKDQDQEDDDDVSEMREMNIIPSAAASLEPIFEALSLCASLHPDPRDSEDDPMDADADDAFIAPGHSPFETFTGDPDQELSEVGRAALDHLESIIDYGGHAPPAADADADAGDKEKEKEKEAEARAPTQDA
ncbi:pICln family protein [Pleurotus pulmonarius]